MPLLAVLVMLGGVAVLCEAAPHSASSAQDAYARALELQKQGNESAALSLLWEAAGAAPRNADIQNALGEALARIGALDAAVEAFRTAVAERPTFRKAQNNLILTLVGAGKGGEAVERARALVAASPNDPDRHFTLGLAQSEQDVTGAMTSFRRTIALAPRHVLARYNLALVLRRVDRLTEAIEELQAARAIEPRPELSYTLGVIHWHQGDLDRADQALRSAIAIEPRYDAYDALGSVLKAKGRYADAAEMLRRAVALRPDRPALHYALGQVLLVKGEADEAKAQMAEADRLRQRAQLEQEAASLTAVGSAALNRGDVAGALGYFGRAIVTFDEYAPAYYQRGLALRRAGQPDAARAAFEKARQLNPSLVPPGTQPRSDR